MGRRLRARQPEPGQAADLHLLLSGTARLDPRYRVGVAAPDLVFLLGDEESHALRGELWARLAPWLDGRDADAVAAASGLTRLDLEHALAELARRGLLASDVAADEGAPAAPPAATLPPGLALVVAARPGLDAAPLAAALAARGLAASPPGAPAVVLTDDLLAPELAAIDRAVRAAGSRWLPLRVGRRAAWLGPWLGGAADPCWSCLAADLARCRPVEALCHRLGAAPPPEPPAPAALAAAAGWLVAVLAAGDPPLAGGLLAVHLQRGALRRHVARRDPRCPQCGVPQPRRAVAVRLASRPIAAGADGGWRAATVAATRRRLAPFVSPLTGWVRSVEPRALDPELGTHVAVALHPHPVAPTRWQDLAARPRVAAAGKGLSREQAEVGAVAEAIERACGVFRGDEPRRRARQAELGQAAIGAGEVLLLSECQVAAARAAGEQPLPDPASPLDWTPLWSLTHRRRRFLPTTLCYYAYRGDGWRRPATSNGCAAGNRREEAILQGLLELVERDAVALWWRHRLARPPFAAPPAVAERVAAAARAHARAGRALALLDLTADLGVPVVAAVSRPEADGGALLGFGAHLDPALAAGRALAELHQFWPPGATPGRFAPVVPWLAVDPAAPAAPAVAGPPARDLRDAVEDLVARLAARGLETLVLDQTRAGAPLAVVRVVVPGLRPWSRRFAAGRLYDVPLALGWLAAPAVEDDLNSDPLEV